MSDLTEDSPLPSRWQYAHFKMPVKSAGDLNDFPGVIHHIRAWHNTQASWLPFYDCNNQSRSDTLADYRRCLCSGMLVNIIYHLNAWIMSSLMVRLPRSVRQVKQHCCCYLKWRGCLDCWSQWQLAHRNYQSVLSYRKIQPGADQPVYQRK